ncbi:MAG: sigma-70 family RNA polymerase sigma factor [Saprospiraceae bacterium]|nr:sigma-70 family RNA polymerase sigma factor [Saprospiraceae bacterium]
MNEESDLIQACIRKEEWAQQRLYEDNYKKMLTICMRYAGSEEDAVDILHDGFFKILTHLTSYEPNTSLQAWMNRIMVNTCIDYYRYKSKRYTTEIDTVMDLKSPFVNPLDTITIEEIMTAVQTLPETYRSVFNLYIIDGYSHKEISVKLNITESTSRSNLVKARQKLKELLRTDEEK